MADLLHPDSELEEMEIAILRAELQTLIEETESSERLETLKKIDFYLDELDGIHALLSEFEQQQQINNPPHS